MEDARLALFADRMLREHCYNCDCALPDEWADPVCAECFQDLMREADEAFRLIGT